MTNIKLSPNKLITNEAYQEVLNEVYGGTIQPLSKVFNTKSTTVHKCTTCGLVFFAMPHLLVNNEEQKHDCNKGGGIHSTHKYTKHPKPKKESQKDREQREELVTALLALEAGYSVEEVTEEMDITAGVLGKWARQFGIKISKERKCKGTAPTKN